MATNSTYTVSGMTCGSCASKVTDHVEQIDGVTDVAVDTSTGSLMVTTDAPVTDDAVHTAIK
ncbi:MULTISPECIES: heavy-metal-associated domain-containing protein [Dermacoccus]|uniref:Heavy-metal-associated domain-containing protein n=3 Tax=Dermacoccus TaxID=57495 RepID=A0A417Z1E1_9MICO|nr:heavy metal-associated domain-containing protein [Dermacoccus abyssi]RHW44344.1 heavy-metal-associated domain-containing protein [Dermacoccus abyssi]